MPVLLVNENETPVLPSIGQFPVIGDELFEPTIGDEEFPQEKSSDPTAGKTLGAAFRLENTIASGYTALTDGVRTDDEIDPDFDFTEAIPERYQMRASDYALVNNQRQADAVTRKIDGEIEDRRIVQEAGVFGVVSMFAAAAIDPVNLIPIGGTAYKTYRLGGSILQSAAVTARAGLLSSTAAESVLQHTQTTRTLGEGAVNIAAGTFLSGVLGGSFGAFRSLSKAGRLGRAVEHTNEVIAGADPGRRTSASDPGALVSRSIDDVTASIDSDLTVPPPNTLDIIMPNAIQQTVEDLASDTGGSVGAAAARGTTIAEETLKSALGMEKAMKFQDPLLRTASSPSIETRRVSQRLSEQILTYEKNALGIETPLAVETRIAQHQVGLYKALTAMEEQFVQYRKGREKKLFDIPAIGISDIGGAARRAGKLTHYDLKNEIGKAMRNNDDHPIGEVAAAAKTFRKEIFDPLKDEIIKLGLLPEDVDVATAPSYLMRVYKIEKIIAQRPEFKRRVSRWLEQQRDIQAERAPVLASELEQVGAELTGILRQIGAVKRGQAKVEKALSEKQVALKRDIVAGNKTVRQAESDLNKEAARLIAVKPSEVLASGDPLKEMIQAARKGLKKPEGLVDWIRKTGGVVDEAGEVNSLGAGTTPKGKKKLIVDQGRTLDDLALEAWEEGFFPLHTERPDINDLLDAMGDNISGATVLRESDLDQLSLIEDLDSFNRTLEDLGVDLSKSDDEILTALQNIKIKDSEIGQRVNRLVERLAADEDTVIAMREALGDLIDNLSEAKGLRPLIRDAVKELKKGATDALKRKKALRKEQRKAQFKGEFEDLELSDIADQIIDRILGTPDGRLPYDINPNVSGRGEKTALSGPLKRRSFLIPDSEIEDFLESDIEHISRVYTRSVAPDIELVREFGDVNMTTQIDDIRRDYAQKAGRGELSEKQLTALNKQRNADIRDIAAMRDRIRGTYALPADPASLSVRSGRVIRTANYLRLLGGMTASAFPDTMRAVMVHGLGRVLGDGVVPLIKDFKATRLAAEEVKLSGTALDMILDTRSMAIADVMDDYGRHSKFERGLRRMQDKFGVVSLMAPWNAFFKQWTGMITMSRMLKAMQGISDGKAVPKELEKLASQGINPEQATRIWKQFKEHGTIEGGVYLPNTEAWTGPGAAEAVRAFRGALKKEVDKIIVTPGQDKPLWMSTEHGKIIGQFKSFAIASVQRTLLSALQQRDLAALNGALLSVGAGMMVYAFKQNDAGRDISDDPVVWLTEGLDRSGLFGWFFDANNIIEKATRGRVGVNALIGGPPMSRYASRNVWGAFLGPTIGLVEDAIAVTGDAAQGEWTQSDTRALRRLLPYQNLIGFRRVLNQAESGINDALGVPGR